MISNADQMEILNHVLFGETVEHQITHYDGAELSDPKIIVIHNSPTKEFRNNTFSYSRPSVHIKIDKNGLVSQLIPFNQPGRHVGSAYWEGENNLDKNTIAIELENSGRLSVKVNQYYDSEGNAVNANDVFTGVHQNEDHPSFWEKYTERQVKKAEQLCRLLLMSYQVKYILGHEEISPGSNVDPGPAFPLDRFRKMILADKLVDMEPAFSFNGGFSHYAYLLEDTFLRNVSNRGKIVNIKPKSGGWYKINIDQSGHIKEEWIRI